MAFALAMAALALFWWRYGDPDRDDRITASGAGSEPLIVMFGMYWLIKSARAGDWFWFTLLLASIIAMAAQWHRRRRN